MPSWLEYSTRTPEKFKNDFAKAEKRYKEADDAATYSIYVGGFLVMILGVLSAADFNKGYNKAQGYAVLLLPIIVLFINNVCNRIKTQTEEELRGLVKEGLESKENYFENPKLVDLFLATFFKKPPTADDVERHSAPNQPELKESEFKTPTPGGNMTSS
jgi:hypothetical protein